MRAGKILVICSFVACAPSRAPIANTPEYTVVETTPQRARRVLATTHEHYPILYPVLAEAELARLTAQFEERSSGWSIVLDSFGLLHRAYCETCTTTPGSAMTEEDQTAIRAFLETNHDIVGIEPSDLYMETLGDKLLVAHASFTSGIYNSVLVSRWEGVVTIRGRVWPRVDQETGDPDVLKAKLRALYSGSNVTYDLRPMHFIARTLEGPVELHEAACWMLIADDLPRDARRTIGEPNDLPCVDARTGEDLTGLAVSWHVDVKDGNATRSLLYVGSAR